MYRSDDFDGDVAHTPTWTYLTDFPLNGIYGVQNVDGDMRDWGTFYLSTNGQGWIKGSLN